MSLASLLLQEGSEPLTPRSEASDVSGMSAEAQAYLERHLAIVARGRGGPGPAPGQKQVGAWAVVFGHAGCFGYVQKQLGALHWSCACRMVGVCGWMGLGQF